MKIKLLIRSVTVTITLVFVYAIYFVLRSITGAKHLEFRKVASSWAKNILRFQGVSVRTIGFERIDWTRSYMIVANHESQLDIPALLQSLPADVRFVAKRSLSYIPFFGRSARLVGTIFVDRYKQRTHGKTFSEISEAIHDGASVIMFPEGTRTRDGRLQEFKKGAFVLAIQHKMPILPIVIRGSRNLLPKGSLGVKSGVITVEALSPHETADLSYSERSSLRDIIRSGFVSALGGSYNV